jgi:HAE1 family hydrophobic/amphiphilic exporter-1
MESLVRWCLKNKSVVILATVLLVGSGAYATACLNQELLPDIIFPIITISTPVVGGGARRGGRAGHPAGRERHKWRGRDRSGSVHLLPGLLRGGRGVRLDADPEEAEANLQSALDGIEHPSQAGEPEVRSQLASEFPILSLSLAPGTRTSSNSRSTSRPRSSPPSRRLKAWRAWT